MYHEGIQLSKDLKTKMKIEKDKLEQQIKENDVNY